MSPRVIISETEANGCTLAAQDVRDLAQVRRLCLLGFGAVEGDDNDVSHAEIPLAKLHLLRGFLAAQGCGDRKSSRRLLLMCLLQLEDEDEARRVVLPAAALPVLARN